MADYEILIPISNGKKPAHKVGTTRAFEGEEAKRLVAIGAIRAVKGRAPGSATEANGEPIGTAQRATAAGTAEADLGFITAQAKFRDELDGKSHKELDSIISAESVGEVEAKGSKPTIAEKVEAIVASRGAKLLGELDRRQLLDLAAASGYEGTAALELAEDAAEDEIRASLLRVAAARADG
ncbi:hypothetical protein QQS45_00055 [Alteriqipengyuania flavescens]|uniref:hypothetical protein n=1 Tax=Alteriqipengyuania flavescens TaxID=3053610 RepID=UPI0025B57CCB|nr:hypothetical protein [Alteriqipengyuania flavescens]WJY18682.1 hypothetical protein QQW98_00055 [Alteriqipengyuania flavescens]WJY24622.1 hypothetical protein QQS45_00055 [Alteriqipengyuania flavescens]